VDGFIAVVAHTVVVSATPTNKVTGRKADVVLAAHYASLAALKLLKAGNEVGHSLWYLKHLLRPLLIILLDTLPFHIL